MADSTGTIATIDVPAGLHHIEATMEQIMGMVSKEAKDVLKGWQRSKGFSKQGDALENLLLTFRDKQQMVTGATIMIEALKADRLISDDIDKSGAAAEAIRRYSAPMSPPMSIADMQED